jgi:hypothetical protein
VRICMVTSVLLPPREGLGHHVCNLSSYLVGQGHGVQLMTRAQRGKPGHEITSGITIWRAPSACWATATSKSWPGCTAEQRPLSTRRIMRGCPRCCARPVVATAVSGPLDLIEDSSSGPLVPRAEPQAVVSALCRLLDDDALSARLGEAPFSWHVVGERCARCARCYATLAGGGKA